MSDAQAPDAQAQGLPPCAGPHRFTEYRAWGNSAGKVTKTCVRCGASNPRWKQPPDNVAAFPHKG